MRDLLRRPGEALLSGVAIALMVAMVATALLLTEGVSRTAVRLAEAGPAMVVRRLDVGGWAPIPVEEALEAARSVRGVQRPRPRVWAVFGGVEGPIVFVGCDDEMRADLEALGITPPGPEEAVVGHRLAEFVGVDLTLVNEDKTGFYTVVGAFAAHADLATYDLILVDADEARVLLGIPPGYASDLVLDVFHDEEADAIVPDLVAAFPWPVRIVTRSEATGIHRGVLGRRGSLATLVALPAALALLFLLAGVARDRVGRRHEVGLLKALGWTTGDIVRLHLVRALWVAVPAIAVGLAVATALVGLPDTSWPGVLLLGWQAGRGPALDLDTGGAGLVLLEVAGVVLVPWLLGSAWPVIRGATRDPSELLEAS